MKTTLAKVTLILTIALVSSEATRAQSWISTSSSDWNTAANWNNTVVPGSTSTATFSATTGLQTTVNLSASDTIKELSFAASAPAYTFTTSPSQTLTIDTATSGNASAIIQDSSATETFNGALTITDSTNTAAGVLLNLTGGNLVFGTASNVTFLRGVTMSSSIGNLSIEGAFGLTSGLTFNWNPTSGILYYDPTSQSVSGVTLRTTSGQVYLQTSYSGSGIVIGGTGSLAGTVYIDANGVTQAAGITMNATTASVGAGTYIFGANASGTASMTQSGNISMTTQSGNTSTDQFDVAANNTLTVTGVISGANAGVTTLQKTSAGTLVLARTNTYTATTSVTAGTLLANATGATGTNAVSVVGASAGATATLGGNGSITSGATANGVTIGAYGVLAPGGLASASDQIDTLTLNMAGTTLAANTAYLSFTSSTAALSFNLGSGNQSSLLSLSGSSAGRVSFDGNTVNFVDTTGGLLSLGTYTLITSDSANTYSGLTLSGNDIVSGLTLGSGLSAYTSAGDSANLELIGDNIDLVIAAVPEPSTYVLVLVGLLICFGCTRLGNSRARDLLHT